MTFVPDYETIGEVILSGTQVVENVIVGLEGPSPNTLYASIVQVYVVREVRLLIVVETLDAPCTSAIKVVPLYTQ